MANTQKSQAELYREQRKARLAKAAKKRNKQKLGKGTKIVITILVIAVIAACATAINLISNGVQYRQKTVLEIEGLGTVSAAEYSYYYYNLEQNYMNRGQQAEQYAQYYGMDASALTGGFDYTVSPELQKLPATNEDYEAVVAAGYENPTWADYFAFATQQQLIQIKKLSKLADEAGYKLDDEGKAEIKENISSIKSAAASNYTSSNKFVSKYYGKGVTLGLVKKIITEQQTAAHYEEVLSKEYRDALTTEEIEAYYNDNKADFNVGSFAFYFVEAEKKTTKDEEGKETSNVTSATMKAAKAKAESLKAAGSYDELNEMIAALKKDAKLTDVSALSKSDVASNFGDKVSDWLFAKKLKLNEVNVFEMSQAGYIVAIATEAPARDDTKMVTVRTIEFAIPEDEEIEKPKDDATEEQIAEYESKVQAQKDAKAAADAARKEADAAVAALDTFKDAPLFNDVAKKKADKNTYLDAEIVLRNYLAGDRTEDAFKALADKQAGADPTNEDYSDKSITEHYYQGAGSLEKKVSEWALDKSRKAGDVGIIENDDCYTLVYFVATEDEANWEMNAKDQISVEKTEANYNEITAEIKNTAETERIVTEALDFYKVLLTRYASQSAGY